MPGSFAFLGLASRLIAADCSRGRVKPSPTTWRTVQWSGIYWLRNFVSRVMDCPLRASCWMVSTPADTAGESAVEPPPG